MNIHNLFKAETFPRSRLLQGYMSFKLEIYSAPYAHQRQKRAVIYMRIAKLDNRLPTRTCHSIQSNLPIR